MSNKPAHPVWPLAALLLLALFLADSAALLLAKDQHYPAPAVTLLSALIFSQLGCVGLFASLAAAHWLVRTAAVFLAIGLGVIGWATVDSTSQALTATIFGLHVGIVWLLALPGRLAGLRWSRSSPQGGSAPAPSASRRHQFSLAGVLVCLTWVAVAAVIYRCAELPPPGQRLYFVTLLVGSALMVICAAWAASATVHMPLRFAALILAAVVLGALGGRPFERGVPAQLATLYVLQGLMGAALILVCRAMGLRMARRSDG